MIVKNQVILAIIVMCLFSLLFLTFYPNDGQRINIKTKNKEQKYYLTEYQKELDEAYKNKNNDILFNIKMARLYHRGVPDRYDNEGKKIIGVKPDSKRAIYYYNKAIENGSTISILDLASLYHFGMHNYEPNLKKATSLYDYIVHKNNNQYLKNICKKRLDDINNDELQTNIKNVTNNDLMKIYLSADPQLYEYMVMQKRNELLSDKGKNKDKKLDETLSRNERTVARRPERQRQRVGIRNDLQNVHDSGVVNTIKSSIARLLNQNPNLKMDYVNAIKEVRDCISKNLKKEKQKDAVKALDTIEKSTKPLSNTDLREIDVLVIVWNRIKEYPHEETKNTMRQNLMNELSECIEYGEPVCSTGRFSHILDTLNVTDNQVLIRPTHVLNQEMMNKAGKIRKDLYEACNKNEQQLIDESIDDSNPIVSDFQKKLKNNIRQQFQNDYVKHGILSQEQIDKEINKWIELI